jgi:succinoglycan biosynthesis transport protein ExoP
MSQSLAVAPSPAMATAEAKPEGAVNMLQIGGALRRRWRWIVFPTLIAFAAATAYVNLATPRYTAETKLLLESRDSFYTRPAQADGQPLIDEQAVASQVQVIMSRDLARETIKRLSLVGNPEFDPQVGSVDLLRRLMILFGAAENPLKRAPEDRVLEAFFDRLLVYTVGRSRVVSVEFRSKDPDLASRAANSVAEIYLDYLESSKKDTARSASAWLGPEIVSLRTRVAEAEARVEAFRSRSGLLAGANNTTITAQQLTELNTQLAQAQSNRADAQGKAQLIRDLLRGGRAFEIPDVANNELIRRLIEQRVTMRAQLALESRTLLSGHPRIKELNAQLADLDAQIRGAAERTVRTLENEARLAGSRVESLQKALDAQKTVVSRSNESEVQLRALEREARAQREQLESYLTRYREATARDADNSSPPDAKIVSRAVAPDKPSFPKKGPITALATLATLVLCIGVIVARELLVGPPEPTNVAFVPLAPPEAAAVAPLVAATPVAEQTFAPATPRPPPSSEGTPAAFDLEALVDRLAAIAEPDRGQRVLVTGDPDFGLALATALGKKLSRLAKTLLVHVDEDGSPEDKQGLTDLIAGEASFADIIDAVPGTRLHKISAGTLADDVIFDEADGLDIAFTAFDHTYSWVIAVVADPEDRALLTHVADRVDTVVIASSADPSDAALVALYQDLASLASPDVVVARDALFANPVPA